MVESPTGIQQGCILGPLLFFTLYADETTIIVTCQDCNELIDNIKTALRHLNT